MLSKHSGLMLLTSCAAFLGCVVSAVLPATVSAQQKAAPQPGTLYVVTYVDVFPNFTDVTIKALQQFASDSGKDPGFVRFEFLQDIARSNHFSIVEVWRDRQAYDAHLTQGHSKSFREKIQAGLGSPFDERLYNRLQ